MVDAVLMGWECHLGIGSRKGRTRAHGTTSEATEGWGTIPLDECIMDRRLEIKDQSIHSIIILNKSCCHIHNAPAK